MILRQLAITYALAFDQAFKNLQKEIYTTIQIELILSFLDPYLK